MRQRAWLTWSLLPLALAAWSGRHDEGASLKDKAAVLLHGASLQQPILIAHADTANLVDIVLFRIVGDSVQATALVGRPCIEIALFTHDEWTRITTAGLADADISPRLATVRGKLYPSVGTLAAVMATTNRTPYVALGASRLSNTSVPIHADPTAAACDQRDFD